MLIRLSDTVPYQDPITYGLTSTTGFADYGTAGIVFNCDRWSRAVSMASNVDFLDEESATILKDSLVSFTSCEKKTGYSANYVASPRSEELIAQLTEPSYSGAKYSYRSRFPF